jgi:hypothetical protein
MKVVIRIRGRESRIRKGRPNRSLALLASTAAWPLGLACFFACAWRWAFDLGWIGRFLILDGLFSHWQVWFVAGSLWQILAVAVKRYAEGPSDPVTPAKLLRKELP